MSKKFPASWWKIFGRVVKTALHVTSGTFGAKQFWQNYKFKFFRLWVKFFPDFWQKWFWQGCKSCFPCVQSNFLRKCYFSRKKRSFSPNSDFERKTFWTFGEQFPARCSELHSTCLHELFWGHPICFNKS